jgi:hypothetical protein
MHLSELLPDAETRFDLMHGFRSNQSQKTMSCSQLWPPGLEFTIAKIGYAT